MSSYILSTHEDPAQSKDWPSSGLKQSMTAVCAQMKLPPESMTFPIGQPKAMHETSM